MCIYEKLVSEACGHRYLNGWTPAHNPLFRTETTLPEKLLKPCESFFVGKPCQRTYHETGCAAKCLECSGKDDALRQRMQEEMNIREASVSPKARVRRLEQVYHGPAS